MKPYNHKNCQSLFGYAEKVHQRSGGICQLCGAGSGESVDFNFWRQLTVEHLIGHSQGGYLNQVRTILAGRFPQLPSGRIEDLARRIDEANTVTACSFCNSTTSRDHNPEDMASLLLLANEPDEAVGRAIDKLNEVLLRKRSDVKWKIESVRGEFHRGVEPSLLEKRRQR